MRADHLRLGRQGERAACRYLLGRGYDVLARRFQARHGEIDIVAFEGDTLVFIEVKTRTSSRFGEPWEFVDWEKRRRLESAAAEYVARFDLGACAWRFDIVSVIAGGGRKGEISLHRNAF